MFKPSFNVAEFVGLLCANLIAVRKQKFMGYTLEWMKEPVSKLQMFRVRDGFSDETLDRINALLEERQRQEINRYFSQCFECGEGFEQTVTPHFLNARLLSVNISTSCGGSCPNYSDNPLNLDIESGKLLELEDLLWLKSGKPHLPRKANGNRESYEYKEKILAPWFIHTMIRLYPREMEFYTKDEDACNYTNAEIWKFDSWYLTPKGIYIGAYTEPVEHCEYPDWSILPWRIVKKHPGRLKGKLP